MKKALTKVLLTAITLVIFAAIIPLSASASTSNNKSEIYKQLTTKLNLNPAAACGIMANMECESGFDPEVVIVDSNGLLSGGLCQWNGGRFNNLQNYCYNYGYDYLSIEGQIAYLSYEMKSNSYGYIYDYLKNVTNDASGAYNAAWYWCYYFEVPANRSSKAAERGSDAASYYWPSYGDIDLKAPSLSLKNSSKTTYDIDNSIPLKWSSGGSDTTNYYLYVTKRNSDGKYDWSKATSTKLGSSTTSKTLAAKSLKKGVYAAYIQAYNSATGRTVKSNYAKFTVKCLTHEYVKTSTTPATFKTAGKVVSTCKQCSAKKTEKTAKLTYADFEKSKVKNLKVSKYTDTAITLKWSTLSAADGYQVYQKKNSKWVRLATVKGGSTSTYTIKNLKPGTKYVLNVRGYSVDSKGKTHVTDTKYPVTAATSPAAPTVKTLTTASSKAKLTWNKVSGADGYIVYMAKGQNSEDFKAIATIENGKTVSYTAKNLKKGDFCYFAVKSYVKTSEGTATSKMSAIKYIVVK